MGGPEQRRSLKARALGLLAQREQSRRELRRKLLACARADDADDADGAEAGPEQQRGDIDGAPDDPPAALAARVDALLDWLAANRHLSDERFAESRVHARAARFGNRRIRQELQQHGVALPAAAAQALNDSEFERACAIRDRKFPQPADGAAESARQARFLIGRGFSADTVRRVLRTPLPDGR